MDAKKLFADKRETYIYLERYVNDGSPSGFDSRTTSAKTSPVLGASSFPLLEFSDEDIECIHLGNKQGLFERGVNYAHPDSFESNLLEGSGRRVVESDLIVSPTAGGRTMFIRAPDIEGLLKLTYDTARLGRVDRQLTLKHCQSSLEVARSMKDCIDQGKLPQSFSLLLEESSKVSLLRLGEQTYEWGVIYRQEKPYPYTKQNTALIPGFSLFGKDMHNPTDELLINQFIELSNSKPTEYLVNVLKMIVDCYWSVVLSCAFHLECHAQNCLFEIDEQFNITRVVIKDMDSVDKDMPLARHFGLNDKWESHPYMCFDGSIYFYSIRPSFIYDFKVGVYLISPMINAVCVKHDLKQSEIEDEIRTYVKENYLWQLPNWYFPADGCWYDCDNSERKPGAKRKYFAHANPKFR